LAIEHGTWTKKHPFVGRRKSFTDFSYKNGSLSRRQPKEHPFVQQWRVLLLDACGCAIFFFAACNVCINQEAANRYNGDTKVLQTISMQQHQKIGCNNTNRATYQQSRTAQSVTMLL